MYPHMVGQGYTHAHMHPHMDGQACMHMHTYASTHGWVGIHAHIHMSHKHAHEKKRQKKASHMLLLHKRLDMKTNFSRAEEKKVSDESNNSGLLDFRGCSPNCAWWEEI